MAGIRILLVGRVVKKIKKARAATVLLIVKLSNIIRADTPSYMWDLKNNTINAPTIDPKNKTVIAIINFILKPSNIS